MSFDTIKQNADIGNSDVLSYFDSGCKALVTSQNVQGISGWIFDIPKEHRVTLTADITDHYTENGSVINDHIVRKPIDISLTGFIGELVFTRSRSILGTSRALSNRLATIMDISGNYTSVQLAKINNYVNPNIYINDIQQRINQTKNIVDMFKGINPQTTKQRKAYNDLYAFWQSGQLLKVQTPWNLFENMVIQDLTFTQGEDSESLTDISITLHEMRFTDLKFTKFDKNLYPPRVEMQSQEKKDTGVNNGNRDSILFNAGSSMGIIK